MISFPFSAAAYRLSSLQIKKIGFFVGPLVFLLMQFLAAPEGLNETAWTVAALAVWMIIWWMTEAIPLSATALLPAIILPLAQVQPLADVLTPYANPVIFLFMGGFIVAIAIQKCDLHLRIALGIVYLIGTRPDRIVGGFMVASAFLSMWISNTATMLMMLPISLSVIELIKEKMRQEDENAPHHFTVCMLLAIAYASSIGGVGTLIGTPPNAIMSGYMQQTYGVQIGFLQWMLVGVPMAIVMTWLMWFVMTRWLFSFPVFDGETTRTLIAEAIRRLGPMSRDERTVAVIAASTALMWMLHPLLSRVIPLTFDDTIIALIGALALFIIPVHFREGRAAITWKDAESLPWGVLILFGGGLSLAGGFEASGLAQWVGSSFNGAAGWPPVIMLALVVTTIMITTTLMSNVASINIFLPIIVPMAVGLNLHPLFLAIPATMAASCAFMLPVSTANNAIAFGTGRVSIAEMVKAGFWLNVISLPVLIALTYLIVGPVFDIEHGTQLNWAR